MAKVEHGRILPTRHLDAYARALGVTVRDLFDFAARGRPPEMDSIIELISRETARNPQLPAVILSVLRAIFDR